MAPPSLITYRGRQLNELEAWVYIFSSAWMELELDPEDLDPRGFSTFGPAVAARHGDEDPAIVAQRLYPDAGEYTLDMYDDCAPKDEVLGNEPKYVWPDLKDADVPF